MISEVMESEPRKEVGDFDAVIIKFNCAFLNSEGDCVIVTSALSCS